MSELPTGWVTIRGTSLVQRLRAGTGNPTAGAFFAWMIVVQVLIQLGMRSALDEFGWSGVIAIVVLVAAVLCAVVLRRSSVRLPEPRHDPYDPHGRFAWMDHADRLTRDDAIEYVLHTLGSGEPVRMPTRPKSIWIDEG